MPELTVTEQAIIDFEKQREAHLTRPRNFAPEAYTREVELGDRGLTPDMIAAFTLPVRIVFDFRDPVHVRRQIETLQAKLVEALVVTQEHKRGINRQRIDLRNIIKEAADMLVIMNGKTPTGRKRSKS